MAARERGDSPRLIAEREGVSERLVRRVVEQHRRGQRTTLEVVPLEELDASQLVAEVVATHRQVLGELAALGRQVAPSSAAVGAVKARAVVSAQLLAVLQGIGVAPPSAMHWQALAQVEAAAKALAAVAERCGLDVRDVLAELDREPGWPSGQAALRRAA